MVQYIDKTFNAREKAQPDFLYKVTKNRRR